MDWGRLHFFAWEVWQSFTRNALMQATAVGTVAVTIVLLGGFLFARETLSTIGNDAVRKIEISAFLSDRVSRIEVTHLIATIELDPRIKSVTYVPRDAGLRELRERFRGRIDTSLLTSNPLPDVVRIRVVDPQKVHAVAGSIGRLPNVARVVYAQDAVQKLLRLSEILGQIGLGVVAVLVFTAAIIISNTIRLTVFARRREIAIMQLVGASSTYIRLPFICEGLIAGLLGASIAVSVLAAARFELLSKLEAALPFVPFHGATSSGPVLTFELLGVGAGVGLFASWWSLGRYLRN